MTPRNSLAALLVDARTECSGWRKLGSICGFSSPNVVWRNAYPYATRPDGELYSTTLPHGPHLDKIMASLGLVFVKDEPTGTVSDVAQAIRALGMDDHTTACMVAAVRAIALERRVAEESADRCSA